MIPLYLAQPMGFEPGTKWQYSQPGIITASRVVEVISGQPFETFLDERLFGPLGMNLKSADESQRRLREHRDHRELHGLS